MRSPFRLLCALAFALFSAACVPALCAADDPEVALLKQRFAAYEQAALKGTEDLSPWRHSKYAYTEPDLPDATKPAKTGHLLRRSRARPQSIVVQVVGPTAVLTGVCEIEDFQRVPRFDSSGQFTQTWVNDGGQWLLLSEHRSMDRELSWPEPLTPPLMAKAKAKAQEAEKELHTMTKAEQDEFVRWQSDDRELRVHRGVLPRQFTNLFRAYEPNGIGYTWDRGDDTYMDFTFSTMFPLLPSSKNYPDAVRFYKGASFDRPLHIAWDQPDFYFAANIRAGQYIGTRPSAPVVGKRFNPLFAMRFWARENHLPGAAPESEDNFLEFVYGHESNGQFLSSVQRLRQQAAVYRGVEADLGALITDTELMQSRAGRAARDNLSRGWDYVGMQFARDWDTTTPLPWLPEVTMGLRFRFNYYLPVGIAQGRAEEYHLWEGEPVDKPRKSYDGVSIRYTLITAPSWKKPGAGEHATGWRRFVRPDRRYALTFTTGYRAFLEHRTVQAEASVILFNILPLTIWGRYGYNSDLVDYYRRDHSLGLSLSYWSF